MIEPFDYHGIRILPDDSQARIPGSVFRYVLAAHEQAMMAGGHDNHRVHLHPLDVELLLAEHPL